MSFFNKFKIKLFFVFFVFGCGSQAFRDQSQKVSSFDRSDPVNAGPYARILASLAKEVATIDYRLQERQPSQGKVGACHIFATTALLTHSSLPDLKVVRHLDVERTFVEIWAQALGRHVEEAVMLEMESLDRLNKVRRDHMAKASREGVPQDKAFNTFVENSRFFFWLHRQTGSVEGDFRYIQQYGAPTKAQSRSMVTTDDLEHLSENLALARLRIMEAETFGGSLSLSREQRLEKVRSALKPIFELAQESKDWDRSSVQAELKSYQVTERFFENVDKKKSVSLFLADLKDHGPLYLEGQGHATTLVGFDPLTKLFWVRDSDDPHSRDYVPTDGDELLTHLDRYAFLEKKKP